MAYPRRRCPARGDLHFHFPRYQFLKFVFIRGERRRSANSETPDSAISNTRYWKKYASEIPTKHTRVCLRRIFPRKILQRKIHAARSDARIIILYATIEIWFTHYIYVYIYIMFILCLCFIFCKYLKVLFISLTCNFKYLRKNTSRIYGHDIQLIKIKTRNKKTR